MAQVRSAEAAEGVAVPDLHYADWCKDHLPDLAGKVAVITGANSGTGFWCANALASKGCSVVLACRTLAKAEGAKQEILGRFPEAQLDVIQLDNMDFASVAAFSRTFGERYSKLDFLVNNAGIMAQPEEASKDGFDVQMQTNHLSHFLLTDLLWPKLLAASEKGGKARVVQHSSGAHWMGGPKFDRNRLSNPRTSWYWAPVWNCVLPKLGWERDNFKRYGVSKLCNLLFGLELQRRIEAAGLTDKVASVMAHPGLSSTGLQVSAGNAGGMNNWQDYLRERAQSAADGSLPLIMATVDSSVTGGMYVGPEQRTKGLPIVTATRGHSKNRAMAQELWTWSEEACKVSFDVKPQAS